MTASPSDGSSPAVDALARGVELERAGRYAEAADAFGIAIDTAAPGGHETAVLVRARIARAALRR